jgi:hypothetical protein
MPASRPATSRPFVSIDQLLAAVRGFASALILGAGLIVLAAAVYLLKSALGINVFSGHSPLLHAALYPLVRG